MVVGEGRAAQGTPLLGRVEFAIFVSSGGAFDHGKKDVRRLGSWKAATQGNDPVGVRSSSTKESANWIRTYYFQLHPKSQDRLTFY